MGIMFRFLSFSCTENQFMIRSFSFIGSTFPVILCGVFVRIWSKSVDELHVMRVGVPISCDKEKKEQNSL